MLGGRKPLVGLDIGSSAVKAVELKRTGDAYAITGFAQAPLGSDALIDGAIANAAAVSRAVESVFASGRFKARRVAANVAGHGVIVKRVVLPDDASRAGPLGFDAAPYLPFDVSEVDVDYAVIGPSGGGGPGVDAVLAAARKAQVRACLDAVTTAGRVPAVLDVGALALQNAFEVNHDSGPDATVALLDVGAALTSVNIARGGWPLLIRYVSFGGRRWTEILQQEIRLEADEAEGLKAGKQVGVLDVETAAPLLDSVTDLLVSEVRRTFAFFTESFPDETIASIYLAGGGSRTPGVARKFQAAFGIEVRGMDPLRAVRVGSKADAGVRGSGPALAVALGLAMRGFDA